MKKQKGITLIALAVTIIVMLILAGVTMSVLTGNNGISQNAKTASLYNELGSIVEKINLKINEAVFEDDNTDKIQILIDNGYIIENTEENYDYVDASVILGGNNKYGKGRENDDKDIFLLDGNDVIYINKKKQKEAEKTTALNINKNLVTAWRVEANDKIVLPFIIDQWFEGNYDCTIDWGDGSDTEHVGGSSENVKRPEHIYRQTGDYNITISGKCAYFDLSANTIRNQEYSYSKLYPDLLGKLIKIESWGTVSAEGYGFIGAKNLVEVAEPTRKTFIKCRSDDCFNHLFSKCENLQTIPDNLFKFVYKGKNAEVFTFVGTFSYCKKISYIPEGLFEKVPNVTNFEETFAYCENLTTIPDNLFDNNKETVNFYQTFRDCKKIKSGPKIWERENQIDGNQGTYANCPLFDKNGLSSGIINKYFVEL